MRILVAVPHYFGPNTNDDRPRHGSQQADSNSRAAALEQAILSLHQLFGDSQAMIRIADRRLVEANVSMRGEVHVVIVTAGNNHVLHQLRLHEHLYHHLAIDDNPMSLGFYCQKALRDRWGNYDYYCYLEDDLILHDPWMFRKIQWFNEHVGNDKVLLPNRFELAANLAYKKCYLDGDLAKQVTDKLQDLSDEPQLYGTVVGASVRFVRPLNPHSGCYFLNAEQMQHWLTQPHFGSQEASFIGPLESAATLGIMRSFKIYKPAPENANFFEIEHHGSRFIRLIRKE
ncbi:MAG TPA: hypothetical protein VMM76_26315 [Pirellulaceae bacterium]|nr:hypothetical protein [Pirellulaceae bacterium]